MDIGPCAHVPHATHAVPAAGHEDVEAGVQAQRVHPAEVPVVLPDHLHKAQQAHSGHVLPARMHATGGGPRTCKPAPQQASERALQQPRGRPHLIILQVPALNLLVQAAGEHVGVPGRQRQPCHLHTAIDSEQCTAHTHQTCLRWMVDGFCSVGRAMHPCACTDHRCACAQLATPALCAQST